MDIQPDPHEFSRDAWEANANIWDEGMGEQGNDFFKNRSQPSLKQKHARTLVDHFVPHGDSNIIPSMGTPVAT